MSRATPPDAPSVKRAIGAHGRAGVLECSAIENEVGRGVARSADAAGDSAIGQEIGAERAGVDGRRAGVGVRAGEGELAGSGFGEFGIAAALVAAVGDDAGDGGVGVESAGDERAAAEEECAGAFDRTDA